MDIDRLNADFGIEGRLHFITGEGGLIQARIRNPSGEALVSTYGGQVLSFRPAAEPSDVLFVSKAAYFETGKAIKGGVPICWPWFGADPENRGRGAHGFVRARQWQVLATSELDDGRTRIVLGLDADDTTMQLWPVDFGLRIEISVGRSLDIRLVTLNKGREPAQLTQALHTYYRVGDIDQTQVFGLEGHTYLDTLDDTTRVQEGALRCSAEVDRIYSGIGAELVVDDAQLRRRIRIVSSGSHSAVVWNPWIDKSIAMGDFEDLEYRDMLCVETSNAGQDTLTVTPGDEVSLGVRITIERD